MQTNKIKNIISKTNKKIDVNNDRKLNNKRNKKPIFDKGNRFAKTIPFSSEN